MELDHKGRYANYMNDEYIKHLDLCKECIKAVFPDISEELLKEQKVQNAIETYFHARIERGDFE